MKATTKKKAPAAAPYVPPTKATGDLSKKQLKLCALCEKLTDASDTIAMAVSGIGSGDVEDDPLNSLVRVNSTPGKKERKAAAAFVARIAKAAQKLAKIAGKLQKALD